MSKETPTLPLGDDDPAHLMSGAHHPVIEDSKKDKHPGITMELERIGALYDQIPGMLADAKLSKSQDDLLALENQLGKLGSLTIHVLRTVTALRVAREKGGKK